MSIYGAISCLFIMLCTCPAFAEPAGEGASSSQVESKQLSPGRATIPLTHDSPKIEKRLNSGSGREVAESKGETNAVVKLFLFLISAIAALLLARAVIKGVQFLSLNGLKKMRIQKFNSLTPLVNRSLVNVATSLWGENRLWSTNFYIEANNDRWILHDRKRSNIITITPEKNCLEVCMKDTNFRIRIILLNGDRANIVLQCSGFSENGLRECLEKARGIIAEAGE
jgi:hypothetical protein